MNTWEEIIFFPSSTSLVFKKYNAMSTKATQLIMSRTNSEWENTFLLDTSEMSQLPCTDTLVKDTLRASCSDFKNQRDLLLEPTLIGFYAAQTLPGIAFQEKSNKLEQNEKKGFGFRYFFFLYIRRTKNSYGKI